MQDILSTIKLTPEDSLSPTTITALTRLTFKGRKMTPAMVKDLRAAGLIAADIHRGWFVACGKQVSFDIESGRMWTV